MNKPEGTSMRLTDRKRAAIIAAAIGAFAEHGFDNTSMDQIALGAGASKTTVYNHFPTKDDLFTAIIQQMITQADVSLEYPYDASIPLEQQLSHIAKTITSAVSAPEFQSLARIVFSRIIAAPQYGGLLAEQTDLLDAKVVAWLRAAHRDGQISVPQPELAAEQFIGTLVSYALWLPLMNFTKKMHTTSQEAFLNEVVTRFLKAYAPN